MSYSDASSRQGLLLTVLLRSLGVPTKKLAVANAAYSGRNTTSVRSKLVPQAVSAPNWSTSWRT